MPPTPLTVSHPDLASQWHPTLNGSLAPTDVSAGSSKKVWWIDALGHPWAAQVNNRTNGTGCPYCAGKAVLTGFNDLQTLFPAVAAEWHPTRNGDLRPNSLASKSSTKVWFLCRLEHEWQSKVANRTSLGQGCPVCAGQKVLAGYNDMTTTAPALAAQWHPTLNAPVAPTEVFRSTAKRFWWVDDLGHEWQASANERSNGSNCPYCSGQRIMVGYNDLATVQPHVATEWHPALNGDRTPQQVTAMNGTKAWWQCTDCHHTWTTTVASRSAGTGCPACAGQVVTPGVNDLASQDPAVAHSWHPTRNEPTTPRTVAYRSNRKFWFLCEQGHEWVSTVNNRTHGQGCPECSEKGGFNVGKVGYLYLLEHVALAAVKVGITNEGTTRLSAFQARGWKVLNLEHFARGEGAAIVERHMKDWWRKELGLPIWLSPADMPVTGGWTETVERDAVDVPACIDRIREQSVLARAATSA